MYYYKPVKDEKGLWILENHYDWKYTNKTESVFTTENGYMGIRASHDFKVLNESKGMFITGLFQKASNDEVTELINCPDVVGVEIIADGEQLSLDTCITNSYERKFNVHTGEVIFSWECELKNGAVLKVVSKRFASLSNRHLFCQQLEIEALNKDIESVNVKAGINGQITNSGAAHFRNTECKVYNKKHMHYIGYADKSRLDILMTLNFDGGDDVPVSFGLKRRSIYDNRTVKLKQNKKLKITKYACIYTSIDENYIDEEDKAKEIDKIFQSTYEEQKVLHNAEAEEFWKYAKINIDGISMEDEATICYSQFQLYGMTPWETDKASIAAKGLSGEGYKGHAFWDTEIYMLPFYYYTYPRIARNLLMYRYNGLEGAREKAEEYGYEGAMYPWESAAGGREETPLFAALNIHTGKAAPVWSGRKEHHVTADIAFAVLNYYGITGDDEFLDNYGSEILAETSKFWVSRAVEKNGRLEILDIIGPDEYDEHIDNNAFTNYMAKFCVDNTLKIVGRIKSEKPEIYKRLNDKTNVDEWICRFKEFSDKIYLPVPNADGIIPQDDTFLTKKEIPNIEKYRKSQVKQSVLLDYSRDEVVDMQVLKQADTVMLLNLFPDLFDEDTVKKNVLFYEARTLHDSSLSYCAHAQACANIGAVDMSMDFFEKALEVDLVDNPYDSVDGLHSASMGGIWNCIIQGYAGLSHNMDSLEFNPHLPEKWNNIKFYINVQGNYMKITVSNERVLIEPETKLHKAVKVRIWNREYSLQDKLEICRES